MTMLRSSNSFLILLPTLSSQLDLVVPIDDHKTLHGGGVVLPILGADDVKDVVV